jgi:hypothetical protein
VYEMRACDPDRRLRVTVQEPEPSLSSISRDSPDDPVCSTESPPVQEIPSSIVVVPVQVAMADTVPPPGAMNDAEVEGGTIEPRSGDDEVAEDAVLEPASAPEDADPDDAEDADPDDADDAVPESPSAPERSADEGDAAEIDGSGWTLCPWGELAEATVFEPVPESTLWGELAEATAFEPVPESTPAEEVVETDRVEVVVGPVAGDGEDPAAVGFPLPAAVVANGVFPLFWAVVEPDCSLAAAEDVARPDVARPDVARPDVARPDVAMPDVVRPDVVRPDVATSPDEGSWEERGGRARFSPRPTESDAWALPASAQRTRL